MWLLASGAGRDVWVVVVMGMGMVMALALALALALLVVLVLVLVVQSMGRSRKRKRTRRIRLKAQGSRHMGASAARRGRRLASGPEESEPARLETWQYGRPWPISRRNIGRARRVQKPTARVFCLFGGAGSMIARP